MPSSRGRRNASSHSRVLWKPSLPISISPKFMFVPILCPIFSTPHFLMLTPLVSTRVLQHCQVKMAAFVLLNGILHSKYKITVQCQAALSNKHCFQVLGVFQILKVPSRNRAAYCCYRTYWEITLSVACLVEAWVQNYTRQSLPRATYPSLAIESISTPPHFTWFHFTWFASSLIQWQALFNIYCFFIPGERMRETLQTFAQKQFSPTDSILALVYKTDCFCMQGIIDTLKHLKCQRFA